MMKQVNMQPQYVFVDDIKKNPNLIAQILLKDHDVSVIFEKRGRNVKYSYLKIHDQESLRLLDEAKNEHKRLKENGYNRKQAFEDFELARKKINDYL
ncbi:hypothetical protein MHK_007314 [Candidatus Magnetomorum sp. HK-1]|nr:hypothetical protein MHK_007314 [Candidatus Magnetomorum sp. HK-1]